MPPRRMPDADGDVHGNGPALDERDLDPLATEPLTPDSAPENGDLRYDVERTGKAPPDKGYRNTDEVVPGEGQEAARDPRESLHRPDET